jgi:glycosyltransferase involved in cell wall biosynthesis
VEQPVQITVVVLTYNSASTIDACLASLAAQRPRPAEVLVVDDASTDGTLAAVRGFAVRSGLNVRVLRNGSHNISRGRNLGLAAAATGLVAFLDSDAYAEPGWTAALADAFATAPAPALVAGDVVTAHASRFAEAVALNDAVVRRLTASGPLLLGGCNMAVDLARLGGERFDEHWVHAEDIEFLHRVQHRAQWTVAVQARVRHQSRVGPGGYFRQMYRYGLWKVHYTARTGNLRVVDFVPTAVLLGSVVAAVLASSPAPLLAFPALSVAETLFVAGYRRPPPRLLPRMLAGWLVKNTGWGLGVLVGLGQQGIGRPPVPRRAAPAVAGPAS